MTNGRLPRISSLDSILPIQSLPQRAILPIYPSLGTRASTARHSVKPIRCPTPTVLLATVYDCLEALGWIHIIPGKEGHWLY